MALWKDPTKSASTTPSEPVNPARFDLQPAVDAKAEPITPHSPATVPVRDKPKSESLIAPDIAIEGKIEGTGHVRIAGRFKGDVDVRGDLTIEQRANVNGSVRAEKVVVGGELVGNIEAASHVELLQSGSLTGDLKAATLTVASGSRMRGQVEFGWDDVKPGDNAKKLSDRNGASHAIK